MYRYYSIMRPVGPGTFPNTRRVKDVVNFDRRQFIPEINREVWGYIEYATPSPRNRSLTMSWYPRTLILSNGFELPAGTTILCTSWAFCLLPALPRFPAQLRKWPGLNR